MKNKLKNKRIVVELIALSLIAFAMIPVAMAQPLSGLASVSKQGKYYTFSVYTRNLVDEELDFLGRDVDLSSITLHITPRKGDPVDYSVDSSIVFCSDDYVIFTIEKQDLPVNQAAEFVITGDIIFGDNAGETFSATGPGWGWGNIHR